MQTSQPDPEPKPDCIERSDEMTNDTKVSLNSNSNVKPRIVKKSPEVEKGSVVRVQPLEISLFASSECLYYERMHLRILRRLEDPKRPHSFLHLAREWYEAFDIITNMLSLIIAESELACAETMKIPESRQDKTEGRNEVGGQVLLVW
ncbi:hypothetical protein GX48_05213 [Paracoccidioides brasiliensis]|nr:hypothetical protein GX48_05213 [Paracoccidioides brasiliensis]